MDPAAPSTEAWSVARLLTWTRDHFQRHGLESPRLCAELLLAHALGCERIRLYTQFERVPEPRVLDVYRDGVRRAAAGEPIAYLIGYREFFSLRFDVTRDVLIPRPETETLVERALAHLRQPDAAVPCVLDVGTGSGCIIVSLARNLPAGPRFFASDVSPGALHVAMENARRHGVLERIEFRAGDLFDAWPAAQAFDVIVSNPPYLATAAAAALPRNVREFEPPDALFAGPDGLGVLRRLIAQAPARLSPGGTLLLEVAFDQAAAVRALLERAGWGEIVSYKDGLRHDRVVAARRRDADQSQVA